MKRGGTRAWLRWLHLWVGLALALPLLITGATGVLLTWADELAPTVEGPAWSAAADAGSPLPWPAIAEALEDGEPATRIAFVGGDRGGDHVLKAWIDRPSEGFQAVLVDPYTGAVTARESGQEWFKWLEGLHRNLLLGQVGRQIVAISSLAMVVLVILGVVLWWPMRRGTLRRLTGPGGLLRWHNLLGLVATPLLLVFALTGVTLTYNDPIMPALYHLATGEGEPADPTISPPQRQASLAAVLESARDSVPAGRIHGFSEPGSETEPYRVRLREPASLHPSGWHNVWIHPGDASVVRIDDASEASWAAWYDQAWYTLHTGSFLGPLPRGLWALAAAILPALAITGAWRWLRRRRRRAVTGTSRSAPG